MFASRLLAKVGARAMMSHCQPQLRTVAAATAAAATVFVIVPTPVAKAQPNIVAAISAIAAKVDALEAKLLSPEPVIAPRAEVNTALGSLMALTPLDGRYASRTKSLTSYFSEFSLIKYRCLIEVEYFIELCGVLPELRSFPTEKFEALRDIYRNFSAEDALKIKATERVTNHDVKAVEYHIKDVFDEHNLHQYKEFIHFALTSQDINHTAIPLSIRAALDEVYVPSLKKFVKQLYGCALAWDGQPMLARTHGQCATPTRVGKEMMVFVERLENQIAMLEGLPIGCKFGGATGGLAAHAVAYPEIDWVGFSNRFCDRLGLQRQQYTTQIEHYDNIGALAHNMSRINIIMIDFCRDMWAYVSLGYFTQTIKKNEVGSSAMPHKVNPIDFENAEGNCGIANAILIHLAAKLPISRMQRDLSDSTVLRSIGVPFGHSVLAFASASRGLGKMNVNAACLDSDLEENWAVCAEAVQTVLRREGYPKPYEALKELTRVSSFTVPLRARLVHVD